MPIVSVRPTTETIFWDILGNTHHWIYSIIFILYTHIHIQYISLHVHLDPRISKRIAINMKRSPNTVSPHAYNRFFSYSHFEYYNIIMWPSLIYSHLFLLFFLFCPGSEPEIKVIILKSWCMRKNQAKHHEILPEVSIKIVRAGSLIFHFCYRYLGVCGVLVPHFTLDCLLWFIWMPCKKKSTRAY